MTLQELCQARGSGAETIYAGDSMPVYYKDLVHLVLNAPTRVFTWRPSLGIYIYIYIGRRAMGECGLAPHRYLHQLRDERYLSSGPIQPLHTPKIT